MAANPGQAAADATDTEGAGLGGNVGSSASGGGGGTAPNSATGAFGGKDTPSAPTGGNDPGRDSTQAAREGTQKPPAEGRTENPEAGGGNKGASGKKPDGQKGGKDKEAGPRRRPRGGGTILTGEDAEGPGRLRGRTNRPTLLGG
jgi:hypothetical protein